MDKTKISKSISQLDKGPLKRVLEVKDLFAIGFGDLGSSIYYALGITAFFALGATPIALALAGLVFVCTALTYAEMSSALPESGGSASFARHAFNDLISFIAGWGLLLDYILTIAISAFAVAPYLAFLTQSLKVTSIQIGFTIGLIVILFFINARGVKHSTRISWVLTLFTLVTQFGIIVIGLIWALNLETLIDHLRINVANASWSPTWPEFWKGTAMAMVAYTGIESIAQLSAEAKSPSKTVPRAVIYVIFVLMATYIGIAMVALSTVPIHELGTTYEQDPIAGIVHYMPVGKAFLGPWVGILAAILLFVASNAGLMGASRLAFNMGEYYQLPRFFYQIHPRFRTPMISLGFFAVLAIGVILLSRGKLSFLADLYNFGAMIAFFSAHVSLIVLRIKKPELLRPFRAPLNIKIRGHKIPLTAIVGALSTFAVRCLIVITKPDGRYLGLTWMTIGIVMYFIYRRKKKFIATGQLTIEKVKVPDFKALAIQKILVPIKNIGATETLQMACEIAKLHQAKLVILHVIEVPFSVPLDSPLPYRENIGQALLQRMEAIAREYNIEIEVEMIHSRSVVESILEIAKEQKADLIVLGTMKSKNEIYRGVGPVAEPILRSSLCRVWVCAQKT